MARHSQINTDGEFGCKIDMVNASKDELIEYLCNTIQYEVEKGEDADYDLVRECSDWLDELTADEFVFTPEELAARLEAIKNGKVIHLSRTHKSHSHQPFIKRKVFARVSILVASLVLLSFLSLSVLAMHAGYDSVWLYISTNIKTILGMEQGETVTEDGITIIRNSEPKRYNTIDELLVAEGLNVMYPSVIPNNQNITEIRYVDEGEDRYTLYFAFSDNSYTLQVFNYYISNLNMMENVDMVTINGINYYISTKGDASFHAICQHNGFEYAIDSNNYEDLLIIINNMKG